MFKDTNNLHQAICKAKALSATHYQVFYTIERRYGYSGLTKEQCIFSVSFFNVNIPCNVDGCITEVAHWGKDMESFEAFQRPNHYPVTFPNGNDSYSKLIKINS